MDASLYLVIYISDLIYVTVYMYKNRTVPRFTGKIQITGKTAEIPERPKNNREILMDASANCENFY